MLGGAIVPFCRDSRSVKFSFDGATLSGGGGAPFGGTTGTVGLAGGGACAAYVVGIHEARSGLRVLDEVCC